MVFVPLTAPGDRVRARIVRSRARFAHARLEQLLTAGADRVEPICPAFGHCGGCAWQHVAYPAQLRAKAQIVADALGRLAGVTCSAPVSITPSPAPFGYRSRARVHCAEGRVGYRSRRSHELCAVSSCPVLSAPLDRALGELAAHPPERDGEWELAAGGGAARAVALAADQAPCVTLQLGDDALRISPGVFFQANALLHEALAGAVLRAAGAGRRALELFAGAGFLTLGLARRFTRVTAVESDAAAVADLAHNLRCAGIDNVEIFAQRVEAALEADEVRARADVVVLDPPRSGLPRGVAAALARAGHPRIVYLSCDAATLARDVKALAAGGYALAQVEAFDLFPQTPHTEGLIRLDRVRTGDHGG